MERNTRKLIKFLKEDGWIRVRTKGGHQQFKHPVKKGIVTIPYSDKELKRGTVASIYRQAGWT